MPLLCKRGSAKRRRDCFEQAAFFLKLPGIWTFTRQPLSHGFAVTAPLTQWSLETVQWRTFSTDSEQFISGLLFLYAHEKTAPPTRCCNFTIHFSAFRRSGFLSDIYIISDLYKTVSVNHLFFCCAELPLMRRNSDILRLLSFSSEMPRPLPLDTPITFQRSSPPDEKLRVQKNFWYSALLSFQISCDGRSEYWFSLSLYIGLASNHFLSVPLRYSADPAPGAFSLFASSL